MRRATLAALALAAILGGCGHEHRPTPRTPGAATSARNPCGVNGMQITAMAPVAINGGGTSYVLVACDNGEVRRIDLP